MIVQATWSDGSVTHTTYVVESKAEALRLFADGLTPQGAQELIAVVVAATDEEIENLDTPSL